jgi:hypothetical protein
MKLVLERARQERLPRHGRVANQVLMQCQAVVIARGLLDDERFEDRPWTGNGRMLPTDLLDRDDGLVAEEAVGIVERRDERVHRALRAE